MARFSQLAVAAAGLAIEDSGIDLSKEDEDRVGIVMGNGNGGFPTTEENARTLVRRGGHEDESVLHPDDPPRTWLLPTSAGCTASRATRPRSSPPCAAGTQGVGEAAEVVRRGAADVVLGGGCEAGICELGLGGFNTIHALSRFQGDPTLASRPFDAERDGFVPAEGAGVLILESLEHALDRGANILAEIIGQGVSSDAFHAVQPDDNGDGAARAIRFALNDAGITPDEVDYINAHGTSTPLNDLAETRGIKQAFGEQAYNVPISSTKSMIGHALGGAGALEAVVSVATIVNNEIHPTINYEHPDPDCDLDYVPNTSRTQQVDTVLSNSFGFGGQNAVLVLRRFEG